MVHPLDIRKKALENHIPIMQEEGIHFIVQYIQEHSITSILEIGSAVGYSAISFALAHEQVKVTTIERDFDRYQEALMNIQNLNLENRITILYEDALESVIEEKFDLIFIDAAKSQYIKFFEKYKENLNEHGTIITDNLSFHGMVEDPSLTHNRNTRQLVGKIRNYIEFLKNNEEFDTTFYSLGDGISVSIKK